MPYDWLIEVERIIIKLVPAYTLETLDNCDVERILPYYFYDYRLALRNKEHSGEENTKDFQDDIVIRDGKKYRKVKADKAEWVNKIF